MKNSFLVLLASLISVWWVLTYAAEDKVEMGRKNKLGVGIGQLGIDTLLGGSDSSGFQCDISIAGSYSDWDPGIEDSLLKFEAEGLQGIQFRGVLNYKSVPVFSFYYERPFSNSPAQKQILEQTQDARTGFKKYTGTLSFDFVSSLLSVEQQFLNFLLSTQISVSREFFVGVATSKQAMRFIPNEVQVIEGEINSTFRLDKFEDFGINERLRFETEFKDKSLTFSILPSDKRQHGDARMGLYHNSWARPSSIDSIDFVSGLGTPLIFETKFKSTGVIVLVELHELQNSSGFNFTVYGKYGWNNTIETAIRDISSQLRENAELKYHSYGIEGWYTWKFGSASPSSEKMLSDSNKENQESSLKVPTSFYYMTVGGSFEDRKWKIGYAEQTFEDSLSLDNERLWRIFARLGYVF